ncbi:MAG: RDD family protein [Bacteroidota bacterium]|nr:RDD family protein [Bacteroidota bacterium]
MSTVCIATNFNIDIEFTAPPFYRRLVAWIIDMVVLICYVLIATRLLRWLSIEMRSADDANGVMWAVSMLLMLPFILYHLTLEITMNGQSIGKKIMGIRVISENGGRPSISQFVIRWLIRTSDYTLIVIIVLIPYATILGPQIYWGIAGALALLIADLFLVNRQKYQRLGDILAHTVLINTRQKERITDTVFLEVPEKYIPQFPQIMQLSDRDMNALKGIIDTAKKHRDHNMAYIAAEKIKAHLKIDTFLEPEDFLEILLKDYNYLSAN